MPEFRCTIIIDGINRGTPVKSLCGKSAIGMIEGNDEVCEDHARSTEAAGKRVIYYKDLKPIPIKSDPARFGGHLKDGKITSF